MKRFPVTSTSIASIGYDRRSHTLELEFRDSGEVYRYLDVPASVHAAFLSAASKGSFLNQIFKPLGFAYRPVRRRKQ